MKGLRFIGIALGLAILGTQAQAEGLNRQPRIAAPYQERPAEYGKVGNFYLGILGGHSWADLEGSEADDFTAGLYLEYRFQRPNSILAWGLEVDVMRTNLSTLVSDGEFTKSIDQDWLASVRGKLGLQLTPVFFPYVTAGYAWSDLDDGIAYGAGLEANLVSNWVLRAEVLRYEFDVNPQTVARAGLGWRF